MTLSKATQLCRVVYEPRATKKRLERQIDLLLEALSSLAQQCHSQDAHASKKHQIVPREVEVERVLEFLVMNELGDALLFATCFEGQVCYDASEKKWYVWAGHFWERCVPGKMYHIV